MGRKTKNIEIDFTKKILLKAELTFRTEHKQSWIFLEPKIGFLDMESFAYPLNQFKDFEVLKVGNNKVEIRHLDTTFSIDLKTSQTFGEIVKREVDNELLYGCMQISISLQ